MQSCCCGISSNGFERNRKWAEISAHFFCFLIVCYFLSPSTRSIYCFMASSGERPVSLLQASCFARPTKSKGFVGASSRLSPVVLCLYKLYSLSNVSLSGFELSNLLFATACSKVSFNVILVMSCG